MLDFGFWILDFFLGGFGFWILGFGALGHLLLEPPPGTSKVDFWRLLKAPKSLWKICGGVFWRSLVAPDRPLEAP